MNKRLISLIMTVIVCMLPLTSVFAIDMDTINNNVDLPNGANDTVGRVLGAFQGIGMIMGIFILTFVGFKYLTGAVFEKAKTKEMLVPFVIGAAIVMMAPSLVKWFWDLKN